MNTYSRILSYVKPYWKHLSASVFCTILYALLNGASVYLTIPLLDTLFQESSGKTAQTTSAVGGQAKFLPQWLVDSVQSVIDTFKHFIFSGDVNYILFKICILVLITYLAKNIFGYMQAYYLAFAFTNALFLADY